MKVDVMGVDAVWLPTDIEERELDAYLSNDSFCVQKKEDGIHILAARKFDRVVSLNRRGEPHGIPSALSTVLGRLAPETMLDGEKLHEGGLVAFDLLHDAGFDRRPQCYADRLRALSELCLDINSPLLRVVETAIGTEAKRALTDRLRAENAEGLIIKDLRAPYTPGRTAWGWTMRRLKFRKSLTCVVTRRTGDTKASFEMFLVENGQPINIGSVSARNFYEQIAPGKSMIAECSYLYATPSRKLTQPTLVRFRDDKILSDCSVDQLVVGGRFAGRSNDSGKK